LDLSTTPFCIAACKGRKLTSKKLEDLQKLFEQGEITQEEFEEQKSHLVQKQQPPSFPIIDLFSGLSPQKSQPSDDIIPPQNDEEIAREEEDETLSETTVSEKEIEIPEDEEASVEIPEKMIEGEEREVEPVEIESENVAEEKSIIDLFGPKSNTISKEENEESPSDDNERENTKDLEEQEMSQLEREAKNEKEIPSNIATVLPRLESRELSKPEKRTAKTEEKKTQQYPTKNGTSRNIAVVVLVSFLTVSLVLVSGLYAMQKMFFQDSDSPTSFDMKPKTKKKTAQTSKSKQIENKRVDTTSCPSLDGIYQLTTIVLHSKNGRAIGVNGYYGLRFTEKTYNGECAWDITLQKVGFSQPKELLVTSMAKHSFWGKGTLYKESSEWWKSDFTLQSDSGKEISQSLWFYFPRDWFSGARSKEISKIQGIWAYDGREWRINNFHGLFMIKKSREDYMPTKNSTFRGIFSADEFHSNVQRKLSACSSREHKLDCL